MQHAIVDGLVDLDHSIANALVRLVAAARSGGDEAVAQASLEVETAVRAAIRGTANGVVRKVQEEGLGSAPEPVRAAGIPLPPSGPPRKTEF